MPFKTVSQKIVWACPWYSVRQDEIVLPDGRPGLYNTVQKDPAVWVLPVTAVCTAVGALAIAGTPPFCIFDSEWMIFAGGFQTEHTWLAILSLFGSLLTVAYALWFAGRVFLGPLKPPVKGKRVERDLPWQMVVPTVFLSVLALVGGLFPAPLFNWVAHELSLILGGSL